MPSPQFDKRREAVNHAFRYVVVFNVNNRHYIVTSDREYRILRVFVQTVAKQITNVSTSTFFSRAKHQKIRFKFPDTKTRWCLFLGSKNGLATCHSFRISFFKKFIFQSMCFVILTTIFKSDFVDHFKNQKV